MISAPAVTIVVNGAIVPSSAPARIVAGRIVAPLTPIVVRLASNAAYQPATATVYIVHGGRRFAVPVLFVEHDVPYVKLAPVIRAIGAGAVFDAPTKTLSVALLSPDIINTPAPFDPNAPQVAPTVVFTPSPPHPTPRGTDPAAPRPRRTAIPAEPSQPAPEATGPRR